MEQFFICCDSADLYFYLLKYKNIKFEVDGNRTRIVEHVHQNGTLIKLSFIHKQINKDLYNKYTNKVLAQTAGTPDYIVLNDKEEVLLVLEDSKTAPVGNAIYQRGDKMWRLITNQNLTYPVKVIMPKNGIDLSNKKNRSWHQSHFYKNFAKYREDIFELVESQDDVYETVFKNIVDTCLGMGIARQNITKEELIKLHDAMLKNIKTYKNNHFRGKLFQPDGSPAHPTQSTLMVISEVRKELGLEPVFINSIYKELFKKTKSKRIDIIKANGVDWYE
jgi:hypothetical protein